MNGDKSSGIHVVHTKDDIDKRIKQGFKFIAYGRIMEIMSIINSAGYKKVALITQNPNQ